MYLIINNTVKVQCLKNISRTRNYYQGYAIKVQNIIYTFLHYCNYL